MSDVIMSSRITRRRNVRNGVLVVLGLFVTVFVFTFLIQLNRKSEMEVEAASLDGFDAGYIISDWQMGNYNSMSEAEIQNFLTSKNSCGNRDYDYYLRLSRNSGYQWHWKDDHFVCLSEELFGDGETIGSGDTAAHILWQTAQDYRINPQALIVLLQKETGLITDPIPNNGDYRKATGYGCPDTAPCSSEYYGFKNQVRRAAALFRTVLDGGWTNYPLGENYIQYNPNPDCGGSVVNVRSLATSALYRYTPYQPNQGAIDAGYGTAYCGAYGNRNFYLYFQDWFGGITNVEDDGITGGNKIDSISDTKIYSITSSLDTNYAIDVYGEGVNDGTNIQLHRKHNGINQQFRFVYNSDNGFYEIVSMKTDKSLNAYGGYTKPETNVQLWSRDKSCASYWKVIKNSDNTYTMQSACSKLVIDIYGGVVGNEKNIQIYTSHQGGNQKWILDEVGGSIDEISEDKVYTLNSSLDNNYVVDVYGDKLENDTNIQLYSKHGGENQQFKFDYNIEKGAYIISVARDANKILAVEDNSTRIESNVQLSEIYDGCGAYWRVTKNNDDTYTMHSTCSELVMDIYGGSVGNEKNIQIHTSHQGGNQKWILGEIEDSISDTKIYSITSSLDTNYAIDVYGEGVNDGTNIQLHRKHNGINQQFRFVYNSDNGFYEIVSMKTDKSLNAYGGYTKPETNVQLWSRDKSCASYWKVIKNSDNTYTMQSACSKLVIDIYGGVVGNEKNIQIYTSHQGGNQKWILDEVGRL